MVGATKKNKKLYEDMRSLGFEDTEFPEWWYSPARAAQDQTRAAQDQTRASEREGDLEEQNERVREPFEPATPRNPVPREGVGGRPILQDTTGQDTSPLDDSRQDSSALPRSPQDTFTAEELDLPDRRASFALLRANS